jgi:YD repeat-containing protein
MSEKSSRPLCVGASRIANRRNNEVHGYDNVTSILRDGSGNATAIVGPFGQETLLGMHPDGYLATVTNPAGETVSFTYTAPGNGLLATMTDAKMRTRARSVGRR